jgi:hypothetical protein
MLCMGRECKIGRTSHAQDESRAWRGGCTNFVFAKEEEARTGAEAEGRSDFVEVGGRGLQVGGVRGQPAVTARSVGTGKAAESNGRAVAWVAGTTRRNSPEAQTRVA